MLKVTLFSYSDPAIRITIEAWFDNEDLVIEGYDIGSKVAAAWGDSDYEYCIKVLAIDLPKLYQLLGFTEYDRSALLFELQNRYHSNNCFSDISKLLQENNIPSHGFSWM